jgi:YDG domain/MBG domain (YGX type)
VSAGTQALTLGSLALNNGTGLASNYQFGSGNTGTITVATLAVTAIAKTYDGTTTLPGTSGGYTLSGVVNGDTVDVGSASGAYASANVVGNGGSGNVTLTALTLGNNGAGNYQFSAAQLNTPLAVGLITPAPLTVTADNATKPFGQTLTFSGTEFTTSGIVSGDTVTSVTLTSTGAGASATVAGNPYTIVPTAAQGSDLSNYSISYRNGRLTVTGDSPLPVDDPANASNISMNVVIISLPESVSFGDSEESTLSCRTASRLSRSSVCRHRSSTDGGTGLMNTRSTLTVTNTHNRVSGESVPQDTLISLIPVRTSNTNFSSGPTGSR